jgi:hypothetical protein
MGLMSNSNNDLKTSPGASVRPTSSRSVGPKFSLGLSCDTYVASIGVKNKIPIHIPPYNLISLGCPNLIYSKIIYVLPIFLIEKTIPLKKLGFKIYPKGFFI